MFALQKQKGSSKFGTKQALPHPEEHAEALADTSIYQSLRKRVLRSKHEDSVEEKDQPHHAPTDSAGPSSTIREASASHKIVHKKGSPSKGSLGRLFRRLRNKQAGAQAFKIHPHDVVAEVIVTIIQVNEVKATKPRFEVALQGSMERSQPFDPVGGLLRPVTYRFKITDITSDLYVFVMEDFSVLESQQCVGHVIIPITRYLTLTEPLPFQIETWQLYPLGNHKVYEKYRSGVSKAPLSAMPSTGKHLGYITLSIRFENFVYPVWALYLLSAPYNTEEHSSGKKRKQEVSVNVMKKNFERLKRAICVPPLLKALCTLPWSFLLPCMPIYIFILAQWWHWPIFMLFCVIVSIIFCRMNQLLKCLLGQQANGAMVRAERTYDHVKLWDDQVERSSSGALEKWKQLKSMMFKLQDAFGKLASFVEVQTNLWSWVDSKATTLGIALLSVLCLVLSVLLYFVPVGWFLCACCQPFCLLIILKSTSSTVQVDPMKFPSTTEENSDNDDEGGEDSDHNTSDRDTDDNQSSVEDPCMNLPHAPTAPRKKLSPAQIMKNFVRRIPDALEEEHRYIAETAWQGGQAHQAQPKVGSSESQTQLVKETHSESLKPPLKHISLEGVKPPSKHTPKLQASL